MSGEAPYDHHQTLYGTLTRDIFGLNTVSDFWLSDRYLSSVDTVLPTKEGGTSWFQTPLDYNSNNVRIIFKGGLQRLTCH